MQVRKYSSEGIYLRTFESYASAARAVKTDTASISKAIKAGTKSKGYYWLKAEGPKKLKIKVLSYRRGGKSILIYKKGKLFYQSSTISEASDITGIPESTIRNICKGAKPKNEIYTFNYSR